MRRAVLLTAPGEKINVSCLPWEITTDSSFAPAAPSTTVQSQHTENKSQALDLKNAATRAEYETIMNVLQKVNFNKKKAAELLNIDRKTLYNKIKNFQD